MEYLPVSFFLFSILISSAAGACDRCAHQSRAGFYGSSAISGGACGYGPLAQNLSGGFVLAASSALFRNGSGCGSCYQIRCKDWTLCTGVGVIVLVTDLHKGDQMELVLSSQAFNSMAKAGAAPTLVGRGIIDVEYRRVPCSMYSNRTLSLRVEEHSTNPHHLALKVLYQEGQTDIVAFDIAVVNSTAWHAVQHNYGAVWSTSQVPNGPLKVRFTVISGTGRKMIWTDKQVLPADWKNGVTYDTGIQIWDIAQEMCSPCDTSVWH